MRCALPVHTWREFCRDVSRVPFPPSRSPNCEDVNVAARRVAQRRSSDGPPARVRWSSSVAVPALGSAGGNAAIRGRLREQVAQEIGACRAETSRLRASSTANVTTSDRRRTGQPATISNSRRRLARSSLERRERSPAPTPPDGSRLPLLAIRPRAEDRVRPAEAQLGCPRSLRRSRRTSPATRARGSRRSLPLSDHSEAPGKSDSSARVYVEITPYSPVSRTTRPGTGFPCHGSNVASRSST